MNIYTHVTYEVVPKKGAPLMFHNNACFASVINMEPRPEKVIYSPTILPFYSMVQAVGYGAIVSSPDAAVRWTQVLNQMFQSVSDPPGHPIFTSGQGQPITYNVPEEAHRHIGIFKLHLFMMRHAFNQPQVFNFLKILYNNRNDLTPEEIYKGCLFLSGFGQLKEKWGIMYDDVHNIFGRDELTRHYKFLPYEDFLHRVKTSGEVATSWYRHDRKMPSYPSFDKRWENTEKVRCSPTEFREALREGFEQYLKVNEQEKAEDEKEAIRTGLSELRNTVVAAFR